MNTRPVGNFQNGFGGGRRRFSSPVIKPKDFKGTFKRLWEYFLDEKKSLIIVFLFIIITSLISLLVPFLTGKAIDSMSIKNNLVDFTALKIIIFVLIISYLIDAVTNFLQSYIIASVSQKIVKNLRKSLFNKLQKLPISFFDTHSNGDVMSRLTNDIDNISTTISQSTIQLMSGAITIIGSFIMMIVLNIYLTIASLVTIPLVFLLTRTIAKKTKVLFKNQQSELGKLNGNIEEIISGNFVIKAFNQEDKVINEFNDINNKLCDVGIKAQTLSGFLMPFMNVINNIGFTITSGVGGILAVKNMITVGVIASFISYSRQFTRPLNELANIFNTLQSALAGAERVFEILDENEEIEDNLNSKELSNINGDITFENVYFGYSEEALILKNINFHVKSGETIALVGPTGAGKTTIINLLSRFYDVSKGKILIDGVDIKNYKRDSLRKAFGIVLQDTYLFSGTIMENIRYGRLDATDDEVKEAAIIANAHSFIRHMKNGYNTVLLENGTNLSQGQKQLLAIARVILSNPSILILDEATSNVDTRTELNIQEAMLKLMKGRSSFIIAHRLSTIRDADTIMVIDNGEIVEKGNHFELMNKNGTYYNMYSKQFEM
ncbi:ABC transporter ATP-binding protein [Clostridium ihumii]|uniref:ABC transporter ATP-binding protein n=1 Tax=Clostridium ihumii TaxID=1470356 RepID=UPI003D324914